MRILCYSHDSYGLGHIRRTISVVTRLLGDAPDASALVLTGAPRAHYFNYPSRCDYLKLPSITKDRLGQYVSRELDMPIEETVLLRQRLILDAARSFRPDVILVDHTPRGLCGEVLPLLDGTSAEGRAAYRVLGLRDIIDEPEAVRAAWAKEDVLDCFATCYDKILVYGQRDFFDPIEQYRIPDAIAERMTFTGYLERTSDASERTVARYRARYAPRTGRLVTITAGGGGDGLPLLRSILRGYEDLGPDAGFELLVISGPLLSPRKRDRIRQRAAALSGVTIEEYHPDVPGLYRASELVVSMAGYNAVIELASAGARALFVPRVFPRREQLERAQRLADRGVARLLHPDDATPERLMAEIAAALAAPRPPRRWGLDMTGLDNASRAILRRPPAWPAGGYDAPPLGEVAG